MGHLVASRGLMDGPGHPVRLTLARTQPVRRAARVMRGHREDGIVTVPAIGRLAAGLTMLVVSSLMTVLAPTPAPAAAATRALLVPGSAGEQTPCRDVFFLGARGSGESGTEKWGLGGTVLPTLNWCRNGVSGLGVAIAGVRYPANPVPFNPLKARAYFRGVSDGVTAAMAEVKERHSWCPLERIVLAGTWSPATGSPATDPWASASPTTGSATTFQRSLGHPPRGSPRSTGASSTPCAKATTSSATGATRTWPTRCGCTPPTQDRFAESGCVRRRAAEPATSHRTAVGGLDPDRRRG